MPITPDMALNAFVGFALVTGAAVILAAGRRRQDSVFLAAFLGLVGGNFLLIGLALTGAVPVAYRLAFLLLALDPVFLILFVRAYPYRARSRASDMVLTVVTSMALVSLPTMLLRPDLFGWSATPDAYTHPLRVAVVTHVVFAYASAWFLAVRKASTAPTAELAKRAAWLVLATGVALVPRVGLLHVDLRVAPFYSHGSVANLSEAVARGGPDVLTFTALTGITYFVGWVLARRAGAQPVVRKTLKLVAIVLGAFVILRVFEFVLPALAPSALSLRAFPYTMRWIVFAVVLAYGILAYEVVALRGAVDRILAVAGAAVVGVGTALVYLTAAGDPAPVIALMLGLAVSAPAFLVTRRALHALERPDSMRPHESRRLEVYRASLGSAWAHGAPGPAARRRLERERRGFGVSYEEARALEHVVSGSFASRDAVAPGDEPVPGIVIERELGAGGQAAVHLARDHATGERVVVKVMRSGAGEDARARQRLLRELMALRGMVHPHIVRLRDVHALRGRYLLVLDHVDGPSLAQVLAKGPLASRRVARVTLDVLDALETVHGRGLVHRDIKPANLLLATKGPTMLADFGIAAAFSTNEGAYSTTISSLQHLEGITGTLRYMAPEQVRGAAPAPATDLYQLGLVVYEALTGRPALPVDGLATFDALSAALHPRIPFDEVPPAWRPVLRRALAPDPAARYPTAEAMRRGVLEVERSGVVLREPGPGRRVGFDRPSTRHPGAGGAAP